MRRAPCASRTLVESALDGRLDGSDRAAVDRHLAGCAECAAWLAGLERLRAEVRRDPSPAPTELELARIRLALLRRAATDDVGRARGSRIAGWIAVVIALVGAIGLAAATWPRAPHRPAELARFAAVVPLQAKVTFSASRGSELSVARTPRDFDLRLVDGAVAFWVRKLAAAERVQVTTLDAAVEVRGTIFRVTARRGRLVRVDVDDGVVEIRRRDQETRLLRAGEHLDFGEPVVAAADDDDDDDAPPSVGVGSPSATAAPEPTVAGPRPPQRPNPVSAAPSTPAERAEKPHEPAPAADPVAADFARAVKNLDAADYPRAAEELGAFARRHPNDARAEDAAFLAIVALEKTGRRDELRAAARDYVRRFPNGARTADVRRWAEAP